MNFDTDSRKSSKTHSEYTFQRLSSDIIRNKLEAGSKLTSDGLRKRYDIGISPLREALSRLAAIGLVTQEGQRGFRVAPISPEDLIDLTRVRIWVECTALRLSISLGDADWEAEILAAAHRLKAEPIQTNEIDERWDHKHRALHTTLVAACGSRELLSYRERLYDLSDRYRNLSLIVAPDRDPQAEHDEMVDAVMMRDVERACACVESHFLTTAEIILRHSLGVENARERIQETRRLTAQLINPRPGVV